MTLTAAGEHSLGERDDGSLPNVSVVIITHNRKEHVLKALRSVFLSDYPREKLEVIVIDDVSNDGTYEAIRELYGKKVNVVRNRKVMFLAKSRNVGFKLSTGDYVLNMDDDCLVTKETIRNLVKVIGFDKTIGVVGPAVYYEDGRLMYCGARIFPFFMPMKYKEQAKLIECEFVPGTIGLFRREAAINAGLWDSHNFTFQAEDADVCLRIRKAGYHAVCAPWVKAHHLKRPSLLNIPSSRRAYEAGRSRILLYKRHLQRFSLIFYIGSVNVLLLLLYLSFITFKKKNTIEFITAYIRGVTHGLLARI